MKLNCDLGEDFGRWSIGQDELIMPWIDQANIACGFHAGDPSVLANTLALAKKHQVSIGAHPSYPDLQGFGRRSMQLADAELTHCLHYQIAAADGMARVQGLKLCYVKPHGALYNDMMTDAALCQLIMRAITEYPAELALMLQATPEHQRYRQQANAFGLTLMFEAFADRCYDDSGKLVSRSAPHALHKEAAMLEQVTRLVQRGEVLTENNKVLALPIDTLCLHGDQPNAANHAEKIRRIIDAG